MKTSFKIPDPARAREFFEDKMSFTTGPVELDRALKAHEDINVIDVRAEEDYQKEHIPGAINLPHERWDSFEGLDKNRSNILYCYSQVCHLAALAACQFAAAGFPVMELEGGFDGWRENGMEVESAGVNRMANIG